MTLRPPQPPPPSRALDAEERALAKALPRVHGRTAPGPDLDASILAAAQAAVHPAKHARARPRPRARWIAPASLAASMVLAVGMAWQLRPLPSLESAQPAERSDSADMAEVQMIEPSSSDDPAPMLPSKAVPTPSAVAERQLDLPRNVSPQTRPPAAEVRALQSSTPRPAPLPPPPQLYDAPPPAPPAPPAPATAEEASLRAGASAKSESASSGNALDAQSVDTQSLDREMRPRTAAPDAAARAIPRSMEQESAPEGANKAGLFERTQPTPPKLAAPAPVFPEARKEARKAADAGFVDDPEQDVPPATVDSPAVRDAWLHRIGELLEQGELQQAEASLAEFKRRYPAAVLPAKLRALEIEP